MALPIFPGRCQPSIVGRSELNFRVRDGNGWTLALISTNYLNRFRGCKHYHMHLYCFCQGVSISLRENGDPYRIRTDVKGVRGLCLNHLTNGPYSRCIYLISQKAVEIFGTPSGTRTLDTLIKSQVLYQLS